MVGEVVLLMLFEKKRYWWMLLELNRLFRVVLVLRRTSLNRGSEVRLLWGLSDFGEICFPLSF